MLYQPLYFHCDREKEKRGHLPCLTCFISHSIKLEARRRVSAREMALETEGEQTRDNNETESDSETLLGKKNKEKQEEGEEEAGEGGGGGERIEERELSQIESVCLGWY